MTQKSISLTLLLLFISLTFWTCKKDKVSRSDDKAICEYVEEQHFDETITVMNNHLQRFKKNDDKALEKFESWLNSIGCVKEAKVLCNSCMKSNPPQSSIQVFFDSQDEQVEMIMHVLMDEKLKVLTIYEPQ